jgi:glycosyltransferase involved in cell wall biosynthesis
MISQEDKIYKIGIDARMYGAEQTGIGNYIKNLIINLAEIDKKNQYEIFLLDKEFDKFILPAKNFKKVKVKAHWYSWREQIVLPLEFLRKRPDLLHFPHFNSPVLYPGKSLVTIHDITPFFFPGHKMNSILRRNAFKLVFGRTVKKARKIIAVSESTKADIARHFGVKPDKIAVIHEGVSEGFKILPNRGKIKEDLAMQYGIRKPFIFYAGVWRNHKNIVGLLRAFALMKKTLGEKYQLVLGGKKDPYYPEIGGMIAELNLGSDIVKTGFIRDTEMVMFYNACSLFVIPSFYEGFGLVGLEAFASGAPVASSNTTSLPEILGRAALYFDPRDPEQIAGVMENILTDDKKRNLLISEGFKQAKKYSWRKMAENTHRIYMEILRDS